MKQKTAMQQAIQELKKRLRSYQDLQVFPADSIVAVRTKAENKRSFEECILVLNKLIPTERQQIENAYNSGLKRVAGSSKQYFDQTFEP